MAQQSNVPEFGNWDEGNVPYTVYFEKARNKKSCANMNLNNPEENPRMFSNNVAPVQAPPFQMDTKSGSQKGREARRTKHVRSTSGENADSRRSSGSYHSTDRKLAADSSLHLQSSKSSSDVPRKAVQPTAGPDRRIEQSPLHPSHQARLGGKGNGTSWERKSSTEGGYNFAALTPERPRQGSTTRGHKTLEQGAAVPIFGTWDESNPASADGYTHVFNKVREEKLNNRAGQVPVPGTPRNPLPSSRNQRDDEMSKRCFCFRWFGK